MGTTLRTWRRMLSKVAFKLTCIFIWTRIHYCNKVIFYVVSKSESGVVLSMRGVSDCIGFHFWEIPIIGKIFIITFLIFFKYSYFDIY